MKKLFFFLAVAISIFYNTVYADDFTGTLEGIYQSPTEFYLTYDSVNYEIVDSNLIPFVLDTYRSGIPVTVDYNLSNEVNFLFTSQSSGYPMQDLYKVVSFMIGGFSCMALIGAIKLNFIG